MLQDLACCRVQKNLRKALNMKNNFSRKELTVNNKIKRLAK